jgi:hypothetical protein
MLRLTVAEIADHVERFQAVYRHALPDPADRGVYEALVQHFADYAVAFMARSIHPDAPRPQHGVVASFLAHGFAGAISAWLSDDSVTKDDLIAEARKLLDQFKERQRRRRKEEHPPAARPPAPRRRR